MAAVIRTARVEAVLARWVGARLAAESPLAETAADILRAYVPRQTALADVARRVEDALFRGLYAALGPGMTAQQEDGTGRRIRMDDLPEMADDVLLVLLDAMTVYAVSYDLLRAYAMETGSRAAFTVLYSRYAAFLPEAERALMARILRERYAEGTWPDWLPLPE